MKIASEKCRLYANQKYEIQAPAKKDGSHSLINLRRMIPGCGFSKGYIYTEHVRLNGSSSSSASSSSAYQNNSVGGGGSSSPGQVPYFCQHNNSYEPSSTCGNTALAMALSAVLGRTITPDYLYNYNPSHTSSGYRKVNSRDRFAEVARSLGASGSRAAVLTESQMKAELDKGRLLVMQGYFTNVSSGHIVLVVGYNSSGFVVYDSNGRWNGGRAGSGYNRCGGNNDSGKGVVYKFSDMRSQSLLGSNFSVGVISR